MKILLIDNYDSFTYNLVHYLEAQGADVIVVRNDAIPFASINDFDKIVLSPGPGLPKDAGGQPKLIELAAHAKPILGVCLGFQALVEFFGGSIYNQEKVKHGVAEECSVDNSAALFEGIPSGINVGLYHSWAAKKENFPVSLNITAQSSSGVIMAFEHINLPVCGVQFHPESVLTEHGKKMIRNFLENF